MRHFLSLLDFSKDEILEILQLSKQIKDETKKRVFKEYMPKKVLKRRRLTGRAKLTI